MHQLVASKGDAGLPPFKQDKCFKENEQNISIPIEQSSFPKPGLFLVDALDGWAMHNPF